MKIIKKDGSLQDFDENKIYTSLMNASRNSDKGELNESDINIICSDVVEILKDTRKDGSNSSSYEIVGILMNVLIRDEFIEVLKSYLEY